MPQDKIKEFIEEVKKVTPTIRDDMLYTELLGIRLLDYSPGYAKASMRVSDKLSSLYGRLHGGAILSFADDTIGKAVFTAVRKAIIAVEIKMNFLRVPKMGEEITAEARVIHAGKRLVVGEAEVRGEEGLIAKATSTYLVR